MKNTTFILASVGLLGYLGYQAKVKAEALARDLAARNTPAPLPPNSGPVVNGLSLYQLEGLGGFRSKFKNVVNKVAESAPVRIIKKIDPAAAITAKAVQAIQDKKTPLSMLNKLPGMTSVTSKLPFVRKVGAPAPAVAPEVGQEETFVDINGKTITRAEYDAIVKSMSIMMPIPVGGGWAVPDGFVMTKAQYETSVYFPKPVSHPTPSEQSPPYAPPRPPLYSGGSGQKNDQELNITNTESDDYSEGPRTAHTAPSAGAPGLPQGLTTTMAQPSVTEQQDALAPMAAPKSKTPMYIVGAALAAGAAYLAFN